MSMKRWIIPKENKELASILADECSVSALVASILVNRGHNKPQTAMGFLSDDGEIGSPYDLKDMHKAVDRIRTAIDEYERIAVYGDYDCDGVTSTAMLYNYLSSIGADVVYYIPERDGEGYGLNKQAIKKLCDDKVSLIVTVDNGISAIDEAAYIKQLGMELIITDHHQPSQQLPEAVAVINPHRKDDTSAFKELCGAGVCFKLISAIEEDSSIIESLGDIAAVGTIGDIVPLVDENRALVKYGLSMLKMCDNIGLHKLMELAGVNTEAITATTVAFSIVPRINAAGRMGNAGLAVRLLTTDDEAEAEELAQRLDECNKKRQSEELAILAEIEGMLTEDKALLNHRVIILHNDNWNHGIIGIVCSKLVERYGKPVMLLTTDGNEYKGSARSIGEFHLFKLLMSCEALLTRFGGHKLAAGFSMHKDDYESFCEYVEQYARNNFDLMPQGQYRIDKILYPDEISVDSIKAIKVLEPFGAANEQPIFMIRNATIEAIVPLSGDKHQKLSLRYDNMKIQALLFGTSTSDMLYRCGDMVDLLVNADINTFKQNTSVSLRIKDIRISGFEQEKFFAAKGYYEKIAKGEEVKPAILANSVPSRNDIVLVYKYLKNFPNGINCDDLYIRLYKSSINYCKMRIIVDILDEMQLADFDAVCGRIIVNPSPQKVDLNNSVILKKMKM